MKLIAKIRGLYTLFVFGISALITVALMYLFRNSMLTLRRGWGKLQTYLMGFSIKVVGNASPDAKLLIMNHQSIIDIVALEATYPHDLCWVAKKEIKDIPLLGHVLIAPKMIDIDRNDKRSMIKMIKLAKERIAEGRVISIFPEGTRGNGSELLPFQNGAKILAEKLALKVQPAIIIGSNNVLDSKSLYAYGGEVKIIYLELIDPSDSVNWYEELQEKMQERLSYELSSLPITSKHI